MRAGRGFLRILTLVALLGSHLPESLGQEARPLSEQELVSLLGKGVSSDALATMVERYGISFRPDDAAIFRLRESGAQESLLESIRQRTRGPKLTIQGGSVRPITPESQSQALRAAHHLELGKQMAQDRNLQGALREFAEAERLRPQWDEILFHRGLALAALHRFSEAAAEWKKCLVVLPKGAVKEPFLRKIGEWEAEAERMENAQSLLAQGNEQLRRFDAEGAVKSFREAVRLDPSLSNLLDLARAYLLRGDYDALAATAREALTLDPDSSRATLCQAAAELGQGEIDKSLATLQQALDLNPSLAYGYALLGTAVRRKAPGRSVPPGAGGDPRIAPGSAMAHNRLGWVLWSGGDFLAALQELDKAAKTEPANDGWYCDLAYARNAGGDTAGAVGAAREAIRLNANSPCGHHALGLALEGGGALDQAAREYEEALKLSPVPLPAYLNCLNRVHVSLTVERN